MLTVHFRLAVCVKQKLTHLRFRLAVCGRYTLRARASGQNRKRQDRTPGLRAPALGASKRGVSRHDQERAPVFGGEALSQDHAVALGAAQ